MEITILYIMLFFILGTIMGSFYNVVGYRLPKGISLVTPSSHCPNCNKRLGFMELIPVISYLIQLGKCKHCKKKISPFYPIFEASTGIFFAISYLIFGLTNELAVALTFSSTVLIVIISDLRYMIIPDELLLFSGFTLVVLRLIDKVEITTLMIDAIVPFITLLAIKLLGDFMFKKESLGGGDIKLMAVLGLVIGWQNTIVAIALAAALALPIALIILTVKKNHVIPFGPFLSAAAMIIYYIEIDYKYILDFLINL